MATPGFPSSFKPEKEARGCTEFSVSERGVRYWLGLARQADCAAYRVDGGIIDEPGVPRCDKLVCVSIRSDVSHAVFVELKGSDFEHAVRQLESTLSHEQFKGFTPQRALARIVSRRSPSHAGNSCLEKAKARFRSKLKCELKVVRHDMTDKIDNTE